MNDEASRCRSRHRRQFLLLYRCPIHASSTARTGAGQSDNSSRRWLWAWLSPWPIWRLPSQRLLRRRVLRRRGGARGGGSPRRRGNGARGGSSPAGRWAFLPSLQCVPMLVCLLIKLRSVLTHLIQPRCVVASGGESLARLAAAPVGFSRDDTNDPRQRPAIAIGA